VVCVVVAALNFDRDGTPMMAAAAVAAVAFPESRVCSAKPGQSVRRLHPDAAHLDVLTLEGYARRPLTGCS
jgi:hypothetical protein